MHLWKPAQPQDFSRAFGLVAVPYFGHDRPPPPGTHLMMQDGDAASFALHATSADALPSAEQSLEWAWSSNVRHTVLFDEVTNEALICRWDDPSYRSSFALHFEKDARALVRSIERATSPQSRVSAVDKTLATFTILRDAIEQRGGSEIDVVIAFNTVMLLAEQWRSDPSKVATLRLADAIDAFRQERRPGFEQGTIGNAVRAYPVGEFVELLLERNTAGLPYLLDANLLIRHASGLVFQEAHRRLIRPSTTPAFEQRRLYDDFLPSERGGRRHSAPSVIHYTPPWLARALVDLALRYNQNLRAKQLDILDPACGSGVFLIEALRELASFRGQISLRGMDISPIAGPMAAFCLGETARDSISASVFQSIQSGKDALAQSDWGRHDIILMNPPFKAWKDLSDSERRAVETALGDLFAGRPDLCFAFIVRAAQALKPGGTLACIVPSPFFSVKSAMRIRQFLNQGEYRLRAIGLLKGFKTFEGALVEAGFVVIARSSSEASVRVVVAEDGQAEKAIRALRTSNLRSIERASFEIFDLTSADFQPASWVPARRRHNRFIRQIASATPTRVKDFFTVRLGVRGLGVSEQSKILIVAKKDLPRMAPAPQEQKYFRAVADRIEGGRIRDTDYVFYPYDADGQLLLKTEAELAAAVPVFYTEVLRPAKDVLSARMTSYGNWWEPSRPVASWLAARIPRIVSQEHGAKGNFALDDNGEYAVVGGHGWCWKGDDPPNNSTLLPYLALLNSDVFERLVAAHCPRLQAKKFKLASRFVHNIPLPDLSDDYELAEIGRRIHQGELYDDDALDAAVLRAYGVAAADGKQAQFKTLADQWRHDLSPTSSAARMAKHPAYQEIIRMGEDAVPYILAELEKAPDHWFIALYQITGHDPVRKAHRGDMRKMARDWVAWGRKHGYRW